MCGKESDIMATKYIFVTGGVVSGLGKGITAASIGRLLKSRGISVGKAKYKDSIIKAIKKAEAEAEKKAHD